MKIISPGNFAGDVALEILSFKDSKEPPLSTLMRTLTITPEAPETLAATAPDNASPPPPSRRCAACASSPPTGKPTPSSAARRR